MSTATAPHASRAMPLLGLLAALLALIFALPLMIIVLAVGSSGSQNDGPVDDIPPVALALYRAAGEHYGLDWAILAAIGKIETDHGRSTAPGVHSGVNTYGCCAGPMQFSILPRPSTWDMFGVDGNGDGRTDVYDLADAIPAAARYLRASGAPQDYRKAIFAYNHAGWYVDQVLAQAAEYRQAAQDAPGGGVDVPVSGGEWLAPVPGMPGEQCDARIIPDVVFLIRRYHVAVTDCYAPTGHAADGEHPLGLATDLVPGRGGSWGDVARLAAWAEPVQNQPRSPFRWVGWNGDAGHGDPAHAGANAHLHLSWDHGPGRPAETVKVFPTGGTP